MLTLLPLEGADWLGFVSGCREATPFHHPEWARLLADAYGYRSLALAVRREDGRPIAGAPFLEVRGLAGRRRWISLPFTDHCPPLATDPAAADDLVTAFSRAHATLRAPILELRASVEHIGVVLQRRSRDPPAPDRRRPCGGTTPFQPLAGHSQHPPGGTRGGGRSYGLQRRRYERLLRAARTNTAAAGRSRSAAQILRTDLVAARRAAALPRSCLPPQVEPRWRARCFCTGTARRSTSSARRTRRACRCARITRCSGRRSRGAAHARTGRSTLAAPILEMRGCGGSSRAGAAARTPACLLVLGAGCGGRPRGHCCSSCGRRHQTGPVGSVAPWARDAVPLRRLTMTIRPRHLDQSLRKLVWLVSTGQFEVVFALPRRWLYSDATATGLARPPTPRRRPGAPPHPQRPPDRVARARRFTDTRDARGEGALVRINARHLFAPASRRAMSP